MVVLCRGPSRSGSAAARRPATASRRPSTGRPIPRRIDAATRTALSVVAAWGIPHAVSTAVIAHVLIERGDLDGAQAALDDIDDDPALLEVTINQVVHEARAALWSAL